MGIIEWKGFLNRSVKVWGGVDKDRPSVQSDVSKSVSFFYPSQ